MRLIAAIPLALTLLLAAPAFADVQQHVQSAKKHERRGEWQKALEEWKAAYSADVNAEYLIGIGDAYAKLGNKDEAKKNYQAYLADPLALPENAAKAKSRIADLDSAPTGLALPSAEAAPSLPALGDLPAPEASGKKGRKKKGGDSALLTMPGLEMPLPGLDLPVAKKEEKPAFVSTTPPVPTHIVSKSDSKGATNGKIVAIATTPAKPAPTVERKPSAPEVAVADVPAPRGSSQASSGGGAARVVAFVAAGVAVAALGGGALAFSKVGAAHSELTSRPHDGATAQALLEDERRNKTVSFIGFAGGLAAAGIATALFAF